MQSLDKEGLARPVAQRASEIEDELFYSLRLDMSVWPHRVEQLVMRHQLTGVLHQMAQNRERLGRQQDALLISFRPAAPQTLVDGVEPEWRKLLHNRGRRQVCERLRKGAWFANKNSASRYRAGSQRRIELLE